MVQQHRAPLPQGQAWPRSGRESMALTLGLAALLGLGVALFVYPPSFLAGETARFHSFTRPNIDPVTYRLAWGALAGHGRPWPSLWTDLFNHPEGFQISLLDGVPLAATIFRPLLPWLPEGFHYFGLWHAVAVTLQGVAGAVFARAAGMRHVLPGLCAAAFALAMPIFAGRLNWSHVALSTQGMLILALALCVHASGKRPSLVRTLPGAAMLPLVALTVQPLLALQVLLFCLLALGLARAPASHRIGAALALSTLFVVLGHALGIFVAESLGARLGLGAFGFSPVGMIVGEPDALRELYGVRVGIEQDAWLGWGCVALLAAVLVLPPRPRIPPGIPGSPLAWVVLALTVAAISPWVRIGDHVLDLSFLLPDAIIELYAIHRATVRLAWPLVILLTFLPLIHIASTWPRRRAALALGLALLLQLVSIWPYWAFEYREARMPVARPAPPPAMLEGASRLLVAPGPAGVSAGTRHVVMAMHLAVETGVPLEGGYFSRQPRADHERRRRDLERPLEPEARYVAPAPPAPERGSRGATDVLPSELPPVPGPLDCVRWEALLVCRAQSPGSASEQP